MLPSSGRAQPPRAGVARMAATSAAVAVLCGLIPSARAADATDFRVLTSVTTDDSSQPIFSNLTIFHGQSVYDFPLDGSRQLAIFDSAQPQFKLLDGRHRMQCRLAGKELIELIAAIGQRDLRAAQGGDARAVGCTFRESFDPVSLRLELAASDETVTYVAVGQQPVQSWAVDAYGRFADWFARLNATRDGRSPEARLRLNEALCKRRLLPASILRRVPGQQTYSSQHRFQWSVESQDLERIGTAQQWAEEFRQVSLLQFRRRQAEASPSKPRP